MKPYIIGHRGAMGSAPENTAASFKKALQNEADGVEFDVHLSKDGIPVVIHDERVDRTTRSSGLIKELTLEQIKQLDAGSYYSDEFRGEKILTLEETLEIVKETEIINIEFKNGPVFYEGMEEIVLKIIDNFKLIEKIIISSFNHYSIKNVKKISPHIKTGLLYMAGLYQPWDYARKIGAEAIHPYFASLTPEIVTQCQKNGIEVNVFGANTNAIISNLLECGVDMIITDYPENALSLRKEIKNQRDNL